MFKKAGKSANRAIRKREESDNEGESAPTPPPIPVKTQKKKVPVPMITGNDFEGEDDVAPINISAKPMLHQPIRSEEESRDYSQEALRNLRIRQKTRPVGLTASSAAQAGKQQSSETGSAGSTLEGQRSARDVFNRSIPDKDAILAAKARREFLRNHYNEAENEPVESDFIPLEDGRGRLIEKMISDDDEDAIPATSRLVREEDEFGEGEEYAQDYTDSRLAFGHNAVRELEEKERREARLALVNGDDEDVDSEEEEEFLRWERQQLKKTGLKVDEKRLEQIQRPTRTTVEISTIPKFDDCMTLVNKSLQELELEKKKHVEELNRITSAHAQKGEELLASKAQVQTYGETYTFFKEFQLWIDSFVDWMQEKMPQIEKLENEIIGVYLQRSANVLRRRSLLAVDDLCTLSGRPFTFVDASMQSIDIIRRQHRVRHLNRKSSSRPSPRKFYEEGMSTDEEDCEPELPNNIQEKLEKLMEDTQESFKEMTQVLERFREWKFKHPREYADAYTGMNLPGLSEVFIRCALLVKWDPLGLLRAQGLVASHYQELSHAEWHQLLINYVNDVPDDMEPFLMEKSGDIEPEILAKCVESYVLPFLHRHLTPSAQGSAAFNPFSARQTHFLCLAADDASNYLDDERLLKTGPFETLIKLLDQCFRETAIRVLSERRQFFPPTPIFQRMDLHAFKRSFYNVLQLCLNMKHIQQRLGHYINAEGGSISVLESWKMQDLTFGFLLPLLDCGLNTILQNHQNHDLQLNLETWMLMAQRLVDLVPESWYEGLAVDGQTKQWMGMRFTLNRLSDWINAHQQIVNFDLSRKWMSTYIVPVMVKIGAYDIAANLGKQYPSE